MPRFQKFLAARERSSREDEVLRRIARVWLTTGVVPVAHIVEGSSGFGEHTSEYAVFVPASVRADARLRRKQRAQREVGVAV